MGGDPRKASKGRGRGARRRAMKAELGRGLSGRQGLRSLVEGASQSCSLGAGRPQASGLKVTPVGRESPQGGVAGV